MKKAFLWILVATWLVGGVVEVTQAQRGGRGREDREERENEPPPQPNDHQLRLLRLKFVNDAEKLALEYENDDELEKAIAVYSEILKLVPRYVSAQRRLEALRQRIATAENVEFEVEANEDWQDSGVIVLEGMPVSIRAAGTWTFNLKRELGPDGMEIPEELRDYNLGCLIAVIDAGRGRDAEPFVVGRGISFVSDRTGRLLFRMYDIDPSDNEGSLQVEIMGTFDH